MCRVVIKTFRSLCWILKKNISEFAYNFRLSAATAARALWGTQLSGVILHSHSRLWEWLASAVLASLRWRLLRAVPFVTRSKSGRVTGANFFIVAMFSDALQNRPVSAVMKAPPGQAGHLSQRPGRGGSAAGGPRRPTAASDRPSPPATQQSVTCDRSFTTSGRPGRTLITGHFDDSLDAAWPPPQSSTYAFQPTDFCHSISM